MVKESEAYGCTRQKTTTFFCETSITLTREHSSVYLQCFVDGNLCRIVSERRVDALTNLLKDNKFKVECGGTLVAV